jgi:ABC-type uncharacterized transport system auxiliary subunit
MRQLHYLLVLSLFVGLLSACMGGKTKPSPAIYDFGLMSGTGAAAQELKVRVSEVTAVESLNSNRMRYRLNYQNPARVFNYTESRWAALPVELLTAKIRALSKTSQSSQTNCSLELQLEAFDHVFDSGTASHSVIQLDAGIYDKNMRKLIADQQFEEIATAPTPDAKGGVAALNQASTAAIAKALDWGNIVAEKSAACH